jgi:hypothetical protein
MLPDLCSVVFVLEPARFFEPKHFMGRAAHKLFLAMLNTMAEQRSEPLYKEVAEQWHGQKPFAPFTVSPLFPVGDHFWMRVTALTPQACAVVSLLVDTVPGGGMVEEGWHVVFATRDQHEWTASTTYAALIEKHWRPPNANCVTLEFITPLWLERGSDSGCAPVV